VGPSLFERYRRDSARYFNVWCSCYHKLERCSIFVYFTRFGNEIQVNDKAIFSVFYAQTFFLFENNSTGYTCNFQKTLSEVKHFVFFPFTLAMRAHESDLFI
jgi:hypothetical protein